MQHSDSQNIDTTTLVFLKKSMCVRAREFVWFVVLLFCCFVVCLRKSARSAGDTGVSFVYID